MRVGVDIDDVLYPFQREMSRLLVAEGLAHCTIEAAHPTWDFYTGWNMTRQEFWDHYHRLAVDSLLWWGPLDNATWRAVRHLWCCGHEIVLVTARSAKYRKATEHWLGSNQVIFDELHFAHDKTTVPTDVFIDDRLENYDQLDAVGTEVYLLNRPWNQQPAPCAYYPDCLEQDTPCPNPHNDHRRRVDSFADFANIVLSKEPAHAA